MRALFLAVLGLTALSMGACSKVDHCEKGALRCLGGFCDNGECDFDLICVTLPENGDQVCAKSAGEDRYDFGDTREPGPATPATKCSCTEPELCAADTGECINYCAVPDALPGSRPVPEVIFCEHLEGEEPFSYEEICQRRCRLSCQRWEQFCGYTCPDDYCDGADILSACEATCPPDDTDALLCLTRACNTTRDQVCTDVICPDTGRAANCQGVVCGNTCGATSNEWSGDGVCDDGDLLSATFADCAWGTDCIDCGPRRGPAPEPGRHGDQCAFNTGCAGFTGTLTTNAAWCMTFNEVAQGAARCVPDCSRGQPCPDGYRCVPVIIRGENGEETVIEQDGLTGQACRPIMCQ